MGKHAPVEQRFAQKHRLTPSGCWQWLACTNATGYGKFPHGPEQQAHRVSWLLHRGPIPDGLCVLHSCDNRGCVNPEHLFLGTQAENVADCVRKNRHARGSRCGLRGEAHPGAKLTVSAVRAIRVSADRNADLARRFAISTATIYRIRRGQIWKDVL